MELLYEMSAVVLFCIAVTLLTFLYNVGDKMILEVKENMYQQHVVYTE